MSGQSIAISHEFTCRLTSSQAHEVGNGPVGNRQYFEVTGGTIEGSRLSGKLLGSGSDWMLVGPDGFMRMDVRVQIQTDDGAVICAHYFGPAEANEKLRRAMAASVPTNFSDHRIRAHWLMETGDLRYAWINQALFVGEGRFCPAGPGQPGFEHRVYRIG